MYSNEVIIFNRSQFQLMYVPQHPLDIVQLSEGQQCKTSHVAAAISPASCLCLLHKYDPSIYQQTF